MQTSNPDTNPIEGFHIHKNIDKKLKRLEDLDITEEVSGPTPRVSPIVPVPRKYGEVCICVNMREAN